MNILNDVVKGASRQFGAEFGRAGANRILKGANGYTINNGSNYNGRIKKSDSEIIKAIKEVNKIKFVSTNKANASRLIDLNYLVLENIVFKGVSSLNQLDDINELIKQYNDKFEHGSALIDNDYTDKSIDLLNSKRKEFVQHLEIFNKESKEYIKHNLSLAKSKRKNKTIATILAFPFLGGLGIHKFYLGKIGQGLLYLFFSFLIIPSLIALFEFFQYLLMSEKEFDNKYNQNYSFYSQFSFTE